MYKKQIFTNSSIEVVNQDYFDWKEEHPDINIVSTTITKSTTDYTMIVIYK